MTVLSSTDRDNAEKKVKSSYFDLPAMNVFRIYIFVMFCCAFASICVFVYLITASDYYHFIELLTPEEQAVRKRVREFMEKEVAPIMTEFCLSLCLFAEFPFHIIPKLGALGVVGGSIKSYGCPGLSITANAIATAEISRVDASCGTFNLVHASVDILPSLDMLTIGIGVDELEQLELQVDTSVRQIRSTTVSKMHMICQIPQVLNSPLPNNINAVMQVPKDVCTVKKPHNDNQYMMKLLTAEDNNITDDLEVTLTITYYNQNATTRLDAELIITDLK
ncbi:hypothetical protein Bca52824_057784 [Brassica carinata]|uniref:Acyl-CoA dehydrogenase/oxidase N-terminal domain-containing protein n=1 Tax=Brassica carinata TaxID=52824 RepID=A0A8X7QY31_BRACI|nr:hypothetical protein Bca52824_057784 [Brassica carinata]